MERAPLGTDAASSPAGDPALAAVKTSADDDLLHSSPFNSSFARQEVEMVVNTI